ncbi:uncharacterized protein BT62DRAFT_535002 [Guyanagaster necrorhizus]|uniref:Uncharacterized protein n=1 Tax=Guyanagaster necrorhizus TaxID=856835 RepID=A0A9P7W2F7_9AGAR|nr:uncharacterized protein BT62DRAFT_535002 [Guyanagaster necrorhizus MCA 3950]KAG7450779.1 hypothetical protein BT62DRAFT_535002 [Guyanagaster necrorhizus MCA 3950]
MPLPDERPRQSVANLIGRFEQQTKRQSISAAPARSSSVVSHNSGDSAKEEVKEKRDWPPRSASSYTTSPSSSWIKPQSSALKSSSSSMSTVPISTAVSAPEAGAAPTQLPSPEHSDPENLLPSKAVLNQNPAPSSFKSPKALTPKTSLSGSTSTPLKPQHTGQSTTSTIASVRKTVARTTTTITAAAARAKTPSRTSARPKTPPRTSAPRAKTPISARPGSGLFAPTAASLARTRDAQAPAPTPKRKSVLSSAVADRLNKPTAASASKARAPVIVPSRGKSVTRGVVMKPKLPSSSSTRVVKKDGLKGAVTGATAVAAVGNVVGDEHAETNGHDTEPSAEQAHTDAAGGHEQVHDEAEIHTEPETHVETEEREEGGVDQNETVQVDVDTPGEIEPQDPTSPEGVSVILPDVEKGSTGERTPVAETHSREQPVEQEHTIPEESPKETQPFVGNDIEDIVNLLESTSRPVSIVSIPDDVIDIPDESE